MTRLARILRERNASYTSVAERARLQPRTVRQIATGETPIDNVPVGTIRRVAAALEVPVADLLQPELPFPGDDSMTRGARLTAAIREVMWPSVARPYLSPAEEGPPDEIAALPADEFFADMPPIETIQDDGAHRPRTRHTRHRPGMIDESHVYRSVAATDDLSSGDIAFLSVTRTRFEGEGPPGDDFDPLGRVPAYPRPAIVGLPHGREIAVDALFALVVTHSCEIDRQASAGVSADHWDCRMTVAPIVPKSAVTLVGREGVDATAGWSAIEANAPVASLYLPPMADVSRYAHDVDPVAWPRSFADLRGLATVSRRMVATDRLCGLRPEYLAVLQRQLARFFTWRDLARHELVEGLVGRRIAGVVPLNARGDRLRVALTADDGSSLTLEVRAR